jgi:hypothetical protein
MKRLTSTVNLPIALCHDTRRWSAASSYLKFSLGYLQILVIYKKIMITPEKARKFMWFCAGIVISMSALYFLQKFLDF